MSSRAQHLARAKHHLEVADHLSGQTEYIDWAGVALFYAAHQMIHSCLSGEPGLAKDERHPRKHTGGPGEGRGGRGTNSLVADLYVDDVSVAYRSLYDLSRRTRYDFKQLGEPWPLMMMQYKTVEAHCRALNAARPDRSTQEL
ncbi:MAG: hypothetical protein ACOH17_14185 [Cellulomonas sp.]